MISSLIKFLLGVVGKLIAPFFAFFSGYNKAKAKSNEKILKEVKEANSIRDRLKCDKKYKTKIRDRFTRHD